MEEALKAFAAALSIGITSIAAAIGQGMMAAKAMEAMGRNPQASKEIGTRLIVTMSITESLAIYGFVTTMVILFI